MNQSDRLRLCTVIRALEFLFIWRFEEKFEEIFRPPRIPGRLLVDYVSLATELVVALETYRQT